MLGDCIGTVVVLGLAAKLCEGSEGDEILEAYFAVMEVLFTILCTPYTRARMLTCVKAALTSAPAAISLSTIGSFCSLTAMPSAVISS